jgi:methylated-DNA-[protein]-cysteine S-methyltransferase
VPSGQNQESKRKLLEEEGVLFDTSGYLVDKSQWWDEFNVEKLQRR